MYCVLLWLMLLLVDQERVPRQDTVAAIVVVVPVGETAAMTGVVDKVFVVVVVVL